MQPGLSVSCVARRAGPVQTLRAAEIYVRQADLIDLA